MPLFVTVLDLLDLAWIVGKERELYVVVVFFGTLDSICSHDPLLSRHNHMPLRVFGLCIVCYLRDTVCYYPLIIFIADTLELHGG